MEVGQYEIDTRMLRYWFLGLSAVLVVSGLYIADISPEFLSGGNQSSDLKVEFENRPLEPNELTTLTVSLDGEKVQGATVRLDNLNVGETNRNGKLMFRGLENDFPVNVSYEGRYSINEIKVEEDASETRETSESDSAQDSSNSDSQDSEEVSEGSQEQNEDSQSSDESDDSQDSNEENEDFTGFKLDKNPVVGETNRLTLFENGQKLENREVQLNGESIGETSLGGSITFTVPNSDQLTVQSSNIVEVFNVEGYENEESSEIFLEASFTKSGRIYAGETVKFDASNTEADNAIEYYNWTLEHENFVDTLQGQEIEYNIPEQGRYDITLDVEDTEGFTDKETGNMNAEAEYSGPEILLNRPRSGEEVGPGYNFEFQIENVREGQQAQINVGGRSMRSVNLEEGLNIFEDSDSIFVEFDEAGTKDYNIEAVDQNQSWSSETQSIEIKRAWNEYGTFQALSPDDGATVQAQSGDAGSSFVPFEFQFDLSTDVNLTIEGGENSGDGEMSTLFHYSDLVGQRTGSYTANVNIEPGDYVWTATIRPVNTSEDSQMTNQRSLTVE